MFDLSVYYMYLQYFDTVVWVFWPVKTVSRITYTVLAGTYYHTALSTGTVSRAGLVSSQLNHHVSLPAWSSSATVMSNIVPELPSLSSSLVTDSAAVPSHVDSEQLSEVESVYSVQVYKLSSLYFCHRQKLHFFWFSLIISLFFQHHYSIDDSWQIFRRVRSWTESFGSDLIRIL